MIAILICLMSISAQKRSYAHISPQYLQDLGFAPVRLLRREYRRSYGVRRRGWANSHVMRPGRGWRRPWEPQNSLRVWRAWGGREGDCKWRMANVQFGRRGFAGHSLPAMRHA